MALRALSLCGLYIVAVALLDNCAARARAKVVAVARLDNCAARARADAGLLTKTVADPTAKFASATMKISRLVIVVSVSGINNFLSPPEV